MGMNLEVSVALLQLRRGYAEFQHGGHVMTSEEVTGLVALLRELGAMARRLENENSRHRWNEAARRERGQAQAVMDAIASPNSNVALFPIVPRPFSDGHPRGAS